MVDCCVVFVGGWCLVFVVMVLLFGVGCVLLVVCLFVVCCLLLQVDWCWLFVVGRCL